MSVKCGVHFVILVLSAFPLVFVIGKEYVCVLRLHSAIESETLLYKVK